MRKMPKRYGAWATIHRYASKKGSKGPHVCSHFFVILVIEWFNLGLSTLLDYPNSLSESHWEQGWKTKLKRLKVLNKITGYTGYTHMGKASLIISPTSSSSRQCSCCNFSRVPSSVEAGRSASNSRCLAGLHFTPKFFPDIIKCNSYATLILSIASLLVATHGKSPQTCSCLLESGLSELASAKSCCSSWTFWAAAASAVRRDWTCQKQTKTNKSPEFSS